MTSIPVASSSETWCPGSLDSEPSDDLLGSALDERGTVAKFLQLPPESIAQLRFLIDAEFVLRPIAGCPRGQPLEDHVNLVLNTRIGPRFGCRGKAPPQVDG